MNTSSPQTTPTQDRNIAIIKGQFFVSDKNLIVLFIMILSSNPSKLEKTLVLVGKLENINAPAITTSWAEILHFMYEQYAQKLIDTKETSIFSALMGKQMPKLASILVNNSLHDNHEKIQRDLGDILYNYAGKSVDVDVNIECITNTAYAKSVFEMNQAQKRKKEQDLEKKIEKKIEDAEVKEKKDSKDAKNIGKNYKPLDIREFGNVQFFQGDVVTSPNGYPCNIFSTGDKIYIKLNHKEEVEKNFLINSNAYDAEKDKSKRVEASVAKIARVSESAIEMLINIQAEYYIRVRIESEFNLLAASAKPAKIVAAEEEANRKALKKSIYTFSGIIVAITLIIIALIII